MARYEEEIGARRYCSTNGPSSMRAADGSRQPSIVSGFAEGHLADGGPHLLLEVRAGAMIHRDVEPLTTDC